MSETPNNKKGAPVFVYLAILFAAAFIMLLLAYFMQQRNNEVAISGLRDSISQFQSLDELRDENEILLEENGNLEAQLEQIKDDLETMTSDRDAAVTRYQEYEKLLNVLSLLYEAELKVAGEDYFDAAILLTGCDPEYLRTWIDFYDESDLGGGTALSLQSRYDALVSVLTDKGCLVVLEDGTLAVASTPD